MAVFTVDTDAVFTATAAMRGTVERLQTESATMGAQIASLQTSWTGAAAAAFQGAAEQWRGAQQHLEQALAAIGQALGTAGAQYAQAEDYSVALFH